MGENKLSSKESQTKRLKIKSLGQQLKQLAIEGTGLSKWEADVLLETINDVLFSDPDLIELKESQLKYSCVSASEGAGKPLCECQMRTVLLTLFHDEDKVGLPSSNKQGSICKRQRRIMRITSEAKEQGGLLSQEDLAEILMCDVRTIRRDIKALEVLDIHTPTRGQQKDIGPGITHKEVAIRLWLEGTEPVEICTKIKHSIKSVENYLEKFKRVAYLRMKSFDDYQTALTIGISVNSVKTFIEIYKKFKNKSFIKSRIAEIELIGSQYFLAQDEKKSLISQKDIKQGGMSL